MSHRVGVFFCAVDVGGDGMVDTSSTAIILCLSLVVGFWQVTWRLFELAVRWVTLRNLWCRGLFFDHRNMCRIKAPRYPGAHVTNPYWVIVVTRAKTTGCTSTICHSRFHVGGPVLKILSRWCRFTIVLFFDSVRLFLVAFPVVVREPLFACCVVFCWVSRDTDDKTTFHVYVVLFHGSLHRVGVVVSAARKASPSWCGLSPRGTLRF